MKAKGVTVFLIQRTKQGLCHHQWRIVSGLMSLSKWIMICQNSLVHSQKDGTTTVFNHAVLLSDPRNYHWCRPILHFMFLYISALQADAYRKTEVLHHPFSPFILHYCGSERLYSRTRVTLKSAFHYIHTAVPISYKMKKAVRRLCVRFIHYTNSKTLSLFISVTCECK